MAFALPLVVPKSRTVNLAGQISTRQTLGAEIRAQSKADLHAMLVGIAREDSAQQIQLGNPPQLVEVDSRTNKPLDQAERTVVVLFGTVLARAAMRMVETELRQAISRSTNTRSGRLLNVGASWEWRFIPRGGAARVVTSANPPTTMARGDRLVLVPVNVPYATAVNRAVANAGRLNAHTAGRSRKGSPPTSSQNLGFLAATTRAVKRRSEFKQFAIVAEFTRTHAVPGEVYSHGTGVITIRPRFRQVRA
jgi:hypothetical protein